MLKMKAINPNNVPLENATRIVYRNTPGGGIVEMDVFGTETSIGNSLTDLCNLDSIEPVRFSINFIIRCQSSMSGVYKNL